MCMKLCAVMQLFNSVSRRAYAPSEYFIPTSARWLQSCYYLKRLASFTKWAERVWSVIYSPWSKSANLHVTSNTERCPESWCTERESNNGFKTHGYENHDVPGAFDDNPKGACCSQVSHEMSTSPIVGE
jgi:hypothetical protein